MSDFKEKIDNIKNNEKVQKAKDSASNAGKKFDEGVSNALDGIKNSDAYNKVMENEGVQKIMNNEAVKKATGFWGNLGKKAKYIAVLVAVVLIAVIVPNVFGKQTVKIKAENRTEASACSHKCKAGRVGFMNATVSDIMGNLYFKADDYTTVYLIEAEGGYSEETTAFDGAITSKDYDIMVTGDDTNGDGYVEFKISKFTGKKYKKVCTIKGKLDKEKAE